MYAGRPCGSIPHGAARIYDGCIENKTNETLVLTSASLDHGCWNDKGNVSYPPKKIRPGETGKFSVESCGVFTGIDASVTYMGGQSGDEMKLNAVVPFSGKYRESLRCVDSSQCPYGFTQESQREQNDHVVSTKWTVTPA